MIPMNTPEELYKWILEEYEKYKANQISKEEYEEKLKEYEAKLKKLEKTKIQEKALDEVEKQKGVVRSTSVAGLRNQILKELRKR